MSRAHSMLATLVVVVLGASGAVVVTSRQAPVVLAVDAGSAAAHEPLPSPSPEPVPLRLAAIGDSVTQADDLPSRGRLNNSWFAQLLRAERAYSYVTNAGIAGNTTAQMRSRLHPEVLARQPDVVFVLGGVNDISHRVPTASIVANLRDMALAVRAAGARPLLGTITPWDNTGARRGVRDLNEAIVVLAQELSVPLVDFYAVTADSEGAWLPGLSKDGLHPTIAASQLMAQAALAVLSSEL